MNLEEQAKWTAYLYKLVKDTRWKIYDDHFSTMEYCPALLNELESGTTASVQQDILGEIISRVYEQEKLSTGIQVIIAPLLLLCLLDRIEFKSDILEFVSEIQQRYLYLKGIIGTQPQRYAYMGEFYTSDEQVRKEMDEHERMYYDSIKANRPLLVELAHDKAQLVQNLAIKCYGLTAFKTKADEAIISMKPLEKALKNEGTKNNTLITIGFTAQLINQPALINSYVNDEDTLYREISKGLAGIQNSNVPWNFTKSTLNSNLFPWYDGNVSLLSMAALINSRKNDSPVIDDVAMEIETVKSLPGTTFELQPHEIIAEWIALAYFGELIPAAHKRPINELNSGQIAVLKKLSGHRIITHTQVLAGLPDTISGLNQYLYQATANKEFQ